MAHSKSKQVNNNNTYTFEEKQAKNSYLYSDETHRESDRSLAVPHMKYTHACVLIIIMATVCFGNSYSAQFVFDDSEAIIGNKDLKPETALTDLFYHDFWGSKLASNTSHKSYRPLTVLTFRFVALPFAS